MTEFANWTDRDGGISDTTKRQWSGIGHPPMVPINPGDLIANERLTIRDYFAAHALCLVASDQPIPDIAKSAYLIADEMLAEKAKREAQ